MDALLEVWSYGYHGNVIVFATFPGQQLREEEEEEKYVQIRKLLVPHKLSLSHPTRSCTVLWLQLVNVIPSMEHNLSIIRGTTSGRGHMEVGGQCSTPHQFHPRVQVYTLCSF